MTSEIIPETHPQGTGFSKCRPSTVKMPCSSCPGLEEKSAISQLESDLCLKRVAATLRFHGSQVYQGAIFRELKAGAGL